jgi:hypothetical protein
LKIGLVGGSYQERSLPFDAQRAVNLYPVADPEGKEVSAMYGTPGLVSFASIGLGPIRQMFSSVNGRVFAVSASELYELNSSGTGTLRGTLSTSSGNCTIDENASQLAICDESSVYILTYSSNSFAKVTDVDLPISGSLTYIDGYFVVNQVGSGRFYISALNDGTSWNALDFASAESSPDRLVRVINAVGQLWLFGDRTTEIWTNSGNATFPFERIAGGKIEVGIMAPNTALPLDNSIFWAGQDENGRGVVYRAQGFSAQRISTSPIERKLQDISSPDDMTSFCYQQDGHVFYVLTGGGLETSLCYDLTTQIWHERAYLNQFGEYEQHRAYCGTTGFSKFLVGDRENNKIYELSLDAFDDDGDAILRERTYTHLVDEQKRIRYNSLVIGFEVGVGLQSGQGIAPVVSLSLSKDGARTWSDEYTTSIGAVGDYQKQVTFRRLGIAEQMTFRIRISDPVKVAIIGSYLNV